jgi:acetylornithine/N-succinyldiaminopimelate aminotransferase
VREHLKHPLISEIRGKGLMLAAMLPSDESVQWVIKDCLNRGLILFGLLYESKALRITPPLTISQKQLRQGCSIILDSLDAYHSRS